MSHSKSRWLDAGIALALAAAAWLLYQPSLRLWWTYDDFYHFRHLITGRPWWYLFDRSEFQRLDSKVLTPLYFLSMDLDRRLFGINPQPFYIHQLLSLSLCPAVIYGVSRIWLRRLWAAVGAWVFLVGPVIGAMPLQIFHRHYVEAILLGGLAIAAWVGSLRRTGARAWALAWLSAVIYFAAAMAKEIAVPLIVLLPLLPEPAENDRADFATLPRRLRQLLPHAAMLALYLGLRYGVLGTLLGGYGFAVTPSDLPRLALALPGKLAAELFTGRLTFVSITFAAALLLGILALLVLRGRRAVLLTGVSLLLALLPILPVSTQMEPRYAVPAWIVLILAFAFGCQALAERDRRLGIVLGLIVCLSGLVLNRLDWRVRFARAERMSAEDRFLLEMREGDVLRRPLLLTASIDELLWMKENVFHRPRGGRWFQDDFYLCAHREPLRRVWDYDPAARRVVDITARIPKVRDRECSSVRWDAPLAASFHDSGGVLRWDLGPYWKGQYSFLIGDGAAVFEMPRSAGFQMRERTPFLPLRVKYESPEGWVTYSPELRVPLIEGEGVRWKRN
jgi:hypothetical protein